MPSSSASEVARPLASSARLGIITGPAGSGKSTLLAQCHAVDPFPAWKSLERAGDSLQGSVSQ